MLKASNTSTHCCKPILLIGPQKPNLSKKIIMFLMRRTERNTVCSLLSSTKSYPTDLRLPSPVHRCLPPTRPVTNSAVISTSILSNKRCQTGQRCKSCTKDDNPKPKSPVIHWTNCSTNTLLIGLTKKRNRSKVDTAHNRPSRKHLIESERFAGTWALSASCSTQRIQSHDRHHQP